MSVRASTAVWDFSEAPNKTVLIVALVLADHADHLGRVTMTIANVADQARVAPSTAWESIRELKRLGELTVEYQGGEGRHDVNIYRLAVVDNLAVSSRGSGTKKVSESSRKALGLSGTKPNSLNTNNARAPVSDVEPLPPPVDSATLAAKLAPIRAQLPKGRRRR